MTKSEQAAIDGVVEVMAREFHEADRVAYAGTRVPVDRSWGKLSTLVKAAYRRQGYMLLLKLLKDGKVGVISPDQTPPTNPYHSSAFSDAMMSNYAAYHQGQEDMVKAGWHKALLNLPDGIPEQGGD